VFEFACAVDAGVVAGDLPEQVALRIQALVLVDGPTLRALADRDRGAIGRQDRPALDPVLGDVSPRRVRWILTDRTRREHLHVGDLSEQHREEHQ